MSDQHKKACTHEHGCISLLDLPDSLISSILRQIPTKSKCQAERVCRAFREILGNPSPGDFVWQTISLDDFVFQKAPLDVLASMTWHETVCDRENPATLVGCSSEQANAGRRLQRVIACSAFKRLDLALCRWLHKRIQGVFVLHHFVARQKGESKEVWLSRAQRGHELVLTLLPFLSGLFSPTASVHLDLRWIMPQTLFGTGKLDVESQYWSSMSTVLTHLDVAIRGKVTKDKATALCQLTRLLRLGLHSVVDPHSPAEEIVATICLDLPVLDGLTVYGFGPIQVRLNCPKLQELYLQDVVMKSFGGMPCSIKCVHLSLLKGSVPLKAILPRHSAKLLTDLLVVEDPEEVTDPDTVKRLCINGRLKQLRITSRYSGGEIDGAASGAFSLQAPWRDVPHTLQEVYLDLPLDKGIPRILEQLVSLKKLSLMHSKSTLMHLDRPLDPFLDKPRLAELWLDSRLQYESVHGGGTMLNWSPTALRFLGLAEKRIKEMRMTAPRRSIILIY